METKRVNKIKRYLLPVVGIFLICFGVGTIIYKNNVKHNIEKLEEESIKTFFEQEESQNEVIEENKPKEKQKVDYVAVIEIPKIKLKRGLVDKNSKYNNVNYNIQILSESQMPDIPNSNLILASHSGNSNISYFKNVNKLVLDDEVIIYYKNKTYKYKIYDIFEVEKTGEIKMQYINNKNITLITCIPNTNKQVVLLGKLFEEK